MATKTKRIPILLVVLAILLIVFVVTAQDWRLAREGAERLNVNLFTVAYAKWGTWWAAAINAVILLVLTATHQWWSAAESASSSLIRKFTPVPRHAWLMFGLILLLAGWLRWERADLGLYHDEAHTFKRFVAGTFRPNKKGEVKYFEVAWLNTFFFNQTGNNAPASSLAQRLSYQTWSNLGGQPKGAVNERVLRLPSVLASLGSLVFLWLVARRLFSWQASLASVLLAAVHFWSVRYGNEARGYAITMMAISAMFYFLIRGLEDHRWRWWLGVGLMQFLALWAFSGAIYFVAVFNAGLLGMLVWDIKRNQAPASRLYRPLVGLTLGGMLCLQLMLPLVPQLTTAVGSMGSIRGEMNANWWRDVACVFTTGLRWGKEGEDCSASSMLLHFPGWWIMTLALVTLMIMGLAQLRTCSFPGKWIVLAGFVAVCVSWFVMGRKGLYLHTWYLTYALPGWFLLLGAGWNGGRKTLAIISSGTLLILTVCSLWINHANRNATRENIRDAVRFVRDGSPAGNQRLLGIFPDDLETYARATDVFRSVEALNALISKAITEQKELWIVYSSLGYNDVDAKTVWDRLRNPNEFAPQARFPGMDESQYTRYVVRWNPTPTAP